jgi:hypothetical protein
MYGWKPHPQPLSTSEASGEGSGIIVYDLDVVVALCQGSSGESYNLKVILREWIAGSILVVQ